MHSLANDVDVCMEMPLKEIATFENVGTSLEHPGGLTTDNDDNMD